MGKNDRDVVARRELTHALEALGDGIGHDTWGPGPVIERLSCRPGSGMAVEALEAATMASHDLLHRVKRDDALTAIRRLAPVFLELIIEKDEGPKPVSHWRKAAPHLFGVQLKQQSSTAASVSARIDEVNRMFRESNERMAKAFIADPHMDLGSIADSKIATLAKMARIKPSPVITPCHVCVGCGTLASTDISVVLRIDGFPRCGSCERDVGASY